jgi:hypothetical protein
MHRKLFGINSEEFDKTGHILIIYSVFIKYSRKNGSTMKQYISYLQFYGRHHDVLVEYLK